MSTDENNTNCHCERPKEARQSPEIASLRSQRLSRNPANPVKRDSNGFSTIQGNVWKVLGNIKQRQIISSMKINRLQGVIYDQNVSNKTNKTKRDMVSLPVIQRSVKYTQDGN